MNDTQQYRKYIECTFNRFCKTVLYHAAINACRDLQRKQQHEVSLDYLREYHIEPTTTDEYFVIYAYQNLISGDKAPWGDKIIVVGGSGVLYIKAIFQILLRFYL